MKMKVVFLNFHICRAMFFAATIFVLIGAGNSARAHHIFGHCGGVPPASQMTEVQPLSFGLFSLRDNDAAHDMAVAAADSSVVADLPYVLSTPVPLRGEYYIEGLPSNTEIFVTTADGGMTLGGGGGADTFVITDFTVDPGAPIMTNCIGQVFVNVGATMRTLGDTVSYPSGAYSGGFDLTIDW